MKLFSNGLKGWKQSWKSDLRASITVAFIAIPLNLGIGLASGVPPMAGVIPCIVGGLLIAWFSGGNIAVHSTPKMLIGVTAAAVLTLGGSDPFLGYRLFLAAVVIAGGIQFLLGILRLGVIGDIIPVTVIKSLLASVGVIIIAKQFSMLLGVQTGSSSIVDLLLEVPSVILNTNPVIAFIGILSMLIMFLHAQVELPLIKAIPAAVWVIIISVAYSYAIGFADGGSIAFMGASFEFGPSHLIDIPSELSSSIITPDFALWNKTAFWSIVLAIVLVSSIEGILSAKALDRLDPIKRKTNVNKELSAMGVGTSISGLVGGLPVIPGIVATSIGVNHNGKGQLMDVFQAALMLLLILALGSQLQHIPLAALAGILIHTGYKLVNPKEIANIYHIGFGQLLIFLVTLVVTLGSDLIYGISAGIILAIFIHIVRLRSVIKLFTILFRPNVVSYEEEDDKFLVSVKGYSNFLNYPRLKKALDVIPYNATVNVDLSLAEFVDHSVMEHLAEYEENQIRKGGNFEIIGMDTHFTSTSHPLSVRFKGNGKKHDVEKVTLTSRQLKMQSLASELEWGFDLSVRKYVNTFEQFHLFRHKFVDKVYNKLIGFVDQHAVTIQDIDFHEGEFQTRLDRQTTIAIIRLNNSIPLFTIEKESLFDKVAALAGYDDIDFQNFQSFSDTFHLKGEDEEAIRTFFSPELIRFLEENLHYRIESSGDSILVISRERLLSEAEIRSLVKFSEGISAFLVKVGS